MSVSSLRFKTIESNFYPLATFLVSGKITKQEVKNLIFLIIDEINAFSFNKVEVKNIFYSPSSNEILINETLTNKSGKRLVFPEKSFILNSDFITVSKAILFFELCVELHSSYDIYIFYDEEYTLSTNFINKGKCRFHINGVFSKIKGHMCHTFSNIHSPMDYNKNGERELSLLFKEIPSPFIEDTKIVDEGEVPTVFPTGNRCLFYKHFYLNVEECLSLLHPSLLRRISLFFDRSYSIASDRMQGNITAKDHFTPLGYLSFCLKGRSSASASASASAISEESKESEKEESNITIRNLISNEIYFIDEVLSKKTSDQPILRLKKISSLPLPLEGEESFVGKPDVHEIFIKVKDKYRERQLRKNLSFCSYPLSLDNYIFVGELNTGLQVTISEELVPLTGENLTPSEIKKIYSSIISEIKILHSKKVGHFDIKPQNIMKKKNLPFSENQGSSSYLFAKEKVNEYSLIDFDNVCDTSSDYRDTFTPNYCCVESTMVNISESNPDGRSLLFDLIEFGYTLNVLNGNNPRRMKRIDVLLSEEEERRKDTKNAITKEINEYLLFVCDLSFDNEEYLSNLEKTFNILKKMFR